MGWQEDQPTMPETPSCPNCGEEVEHEIHSEYDGDEEGVYLDAWIECKTCGEIYGFDS